MHLLRALSDSQVKVILLASIHAGPTTGEVTSPTAAHQFPSSA